MSTTKHDRKKAAKKLARRKSYEKYRNFNHGRKLKVKEEKPKEIDGGRMVSSVKGKGTG